MTDLQLRALCDLLDRLQGDVDDAYDYALKSGELVTAFAIHDAVSALERARALADGALLAGEMVRAS